MIADLRLQIWDLGPAGKFIEPRRAFFQKCVPPFLGFVGHVSQAGGFAREELLPHQPVVREIEGVFQEANAHRTFAVDGLCPLERGFFQRGMRNCCVDHAHLPGFFRGVNLFQKEDLASTLLSDLAGLSTRSHSRRRNSHAGIGLLEAGRALCLHGQVADHVQAVPTATASRAPSR